MKNEFKKEDSKNGAIKSIPKWYLSTKQEDKKPQDNTGVMMTGHIKISDPETGEVIVDKRNAIHYENMSQALANSLANKQQASYTR